VTIKCAEPIMTEDEAWAFMVNVVRELGLLDSHSQIPADLVGCVQSNAASLSRCCPYQYEEEDP
jgi:hypothetical protein